MRLLDKFKKWFFNETKVDIINIADLIQIPGREYYINEQTKLDLIDKYKEEYLKILSQKRRLTTKDISCDDLVESNKMYIDLILRLVMRDNFYDIENQTLLDNKIMISKLKIYLDEIVKIEDEVIERLIALSELEKGRRVPHLNRSTLKSEIDNLKVTLQILISQKTSIRNEIDSYLTHISISDNRVSPKAIEGRRDKTLKYASYVIKPNDLFTDEELTDNNIYKQMSIIAILETEMEKELYINKPDICITDLTWNAQSIGCTPDLNYSETIPIKNLLLKQLEQLEDRFMAYYLFGKNILKYEHWYEFYSAKFKILTFDIADNYSDWQLEEALFMHSNEIERKVYADIIYHKKGEILSASKGILRNIFYNMTGNEDKKFAILNKLSKLLSNFFKDDSTRFEFYGEPNYHFSIEALRLLLSLDSEHKFIRLMNRKINIQSLPNNACFDELKRIKGLGQFVFDDIVPLSTVLEVMSDEDVPSYYKCLKEIYNAIRKEINPYFFMLDYEVFTKDKKIYSRIPDGVEFKDVYFLPEGIKEIDVYYEPYDYSDYSKRVVNESIDKVVIMPKSLRKFNSNTLEHARSIVLNDGIIKIGRYKQIHTILETLDIPSSLEECKLGSIDYSNIKKLRFKDYSNSRILRNPEQLANLLYGALICRTQNFRNKRTILDWPYADIRVDVDVRVMPEHLESIILEENGLDVGEIKLDSVQYYTTLKNMRVKNETYKADSKLTFKYAQKLCNQIIERIELEKKKNEGKVKSKKKV
ncbi:MAG: hypothetical protein IJK66_01290 [Bacilli bacterium]|nr:hypothetical protein [Bacilli bacterium]